MTTPNLVPRNDGEGSIGSVNKRWADAFFSGRINSRGQAVGLKYFVADAATRYLLSGLSSGSRPEQGDIVYQFYPPVFYLVVDNANLGNESGYFGVLASSGLSGKIDIISGSGQSPSLYYGNVMLRPFSGGFQVFDSFSNSGVFNVSGNTTFITSPMYFSSLSSGYAAYINASGQLVSDGITTGELFSLSGVTGNIQAQLNTIVSGLTGTSLTPGGPDLSIQYKDGILLGGDANFKYSKSGAFGYDTGTLRGIFDIRKPSSGLMAFNGYVAITTGAGLLPRTGTSTYNVFPYISISGIKYYHTGSFTGAVVTTGNVNITIKWPVQSGASGYRVIGSNLSTLDYDLTGTGLTESGQINNTSGGVIPTVWGADLTLDFLSNLRLSGRMFINGERVLTTGDLLGILSSGSFSSGVTSLNNLTGAITISGTGNLSVSTGAGNSVIINGSSFITTGQTGQFITTGSTGQFITTGQTGQFVSTGRTGVFITTGQTGQFVTSGSTGQFVTTGNTGSFITTGQTGSFYAASNPNQFISTGNADNRYTRSVNGSGNSVMVADTRSGVTYPTALDAGLYLDFKTQSAINLATSTYAGLLTFRPYGTIPSDLSGGTTHQLAFDQTNAIIWHRIGSGTGAWYSWNKVFTEATDGPGSNLDADTLDGYEATSFALAANTGAFVTSGQTGTLTGVFALKSDTGAFVTTGQTGVYSNASQLNGQSGAYYRDLANMTGSLSGTGIFVTTGQTGSFVTTGQTGAFITSGQTGQFIITGQTGQFVSTGRTGIFVTTGQTGVYSNAAQLSGQYGPYYLNFANFTGSASNTGLISNLNADLLDGQHGAYYRNLANMTGSLSGTGNFVSSSQTGAFVTTGQTGVYANADTLDSQHGAYYLNYVNMTGFIAGTGVFITTGQTGAFYAASNPSQFISTGSADSRYALASNTGDFVKTSDGRDLSFSGDVKLEGVQQHLGVTFYYPNIANAYIQTLQTGACILNTFFPVKNNFFRIRVHGYAYAGSDTTANNRSIDFTVYGNCLSGTSGNISGSGAVIYPSIVDNSTLKVSKWVGINQSGYVAIGIGSESSTVYYWDLAADAYLSLFTEEDIFATGWSFNVSSGTNFGWRDKTELSGSLAHTHDGTGVFITSGQTGVFVTTGQTGVYANASQLNGQSGSYYRNLANATGSLAGTGSFITSGQTGQFVTTGNTGIFVTTSQTGQFVATGLLASGYVDLINAEIISGNKTFAAQVAISFTGIPLSITSTGLNTNLNADLLDNQHGAYYLNGGNMTGTINATQFSGQTSAFYVNTGQTGQFVTTGQTGQFVVTENTGTFVTTTQTGQFSRAAASANNSVYSLDNRFVIEPPSGRTRGLYVDFKIQSATSGLGLSEGTYAGTLTFRPYGDSTDMSGGQAHQLAFGYSSAIMWHRAGGTGWGSWYKVFTEATDGSGSNLDADLLDGQHGSYYEPTGNIQNFTVAVPSGLDSTGILFPVVFGSLPSIQLTVEVSQDVLYAVNLKARSVSGFTAIFSDTIQDTGLVLHVHASI